MVRYAETDKMGIVHHSVYPIWYEVARTDFCKQMGFPYEKMEELGVMTPLIGLECKYKKPALYDDELEVRAKVSKLTPVRIDFSYEVYKQNECINTGITSHALVGRDRRPINVKKAYPELWNLISKTIEE